MNKNMKFKKQSIHQPINRGLAVIIAGVVITVLASGLVVKAAGAPSFYWGGKIVTTISCAYLGSETLVCPCEGIITCPCTLGAPSYYKVFMAPEYGGVLPEPAYCHPAGMPVWFNGLIPVPPPLSLAPGLQIIGMGLTPFLPVYIATTNQ